MRSLEEHLADAAHALATADETLEDITTYNLAGLVLPQGLIVMEAQSRVALARRLVRIAAEVRSW